MKKFFVLLFISIFLTFFSITIFALNPFITHVYTADPSGHEFEGRMYVYPSHDKDNPEHTKDASDSPGGLHPWGFDMEDYHVFSSADLINWVDHGMVLHKNNVDWVSCDFWAPDCAYNHGKYYFYFPARHKTEMYLYPDGTKTLPTFRIGVAVSDSPSGPFTPESNYINDLKSIDPAVFVEESGDAYIFYGGRADGQSPEGLYRAKLNDDMITVDPTSIKNIVIDPDPDINKHYFEAPWVHKYNGKYYLSYAADPGFPHAGEPGYAGDSLHGNCQTCYSMSDSITGDWTYKGVVIRDSNLWTQHSSIAQFHGDWYAFYHTNDLKGGDDGARRSIGIDRLYYNSDGTMQIVNFTKEGTGTSAFSRIKAQFYSGEGKNTAGTDELGKASFPVGAIDIGQYVNNIKDGNYIYFNNVDFGLTGAVSFEAQVASPYSDCTIEIRENSSTGNLCATVSVPNTTDWQKWRTVNCKVNLRGIRNLYLVFKGSNTYLLNLNCFTFKRAGNIPIGNSLALKSLNDLCKDPDGNTGQKYLSVEDATNPYLSAINSASGSAKGKFSILDSLNVSPTSIMTNGIMLNSSTSGKNINSTSVSNPIKAEGGNYKSHIYGNLLNWITNYDGTLSLYSNAPFKYLCADTDKGANPTKIYANRDVIGPWEKFYCEVGDAPIGCIVAFKSLNPTIDKQYLCIDNDNGGDLCANRSIVGGDWEKFEVVDANNGYIALKSLNTNKYLIFNDTTNPGKANGVDPIYYNNDNARFQWRNNGNGTISLFNVGQKEYLCVDTAKGTSPARVYCNKSDLTVDPTWPQFYCQITGKLNLHFRAYNSGKILTATKQDEAALVKCQDPHYDDWTSQDWVVEAIDTNLVRIKNIYSSKYLTENTNSEAVTQSLDPNWDSQKWIMERTVNGRVRLKNLWHGRYLTLMDNGNYASVLLLNQLTGADSSRQEWYNE